MSNYKYTAGKYLPEGCLISTCENREYISSFAGLSTALEVGAICEANAILCDSDMTLTVDLCAGAVKGIIPREEALYSPSGEDVRNIAIITRVGKPVCFKVMSFKRGRDGQPIAILSRRLAQLECHNNYLMNLTPGDIVPARVTHLEHFGAFVDIGCGIVSLLSIDCISISRIAHPRDRFRTGMNIKAVIKSVDRSSGRICVSHKELLGTWEENARGFEVGQTVSGIVRSIEDYGIFIELTPNLAGLAEHRENLLETGHEIEVGRQAAVYIKNIIPDRMKIKLVLIDSYKGESSIILPELFPDCPDYFVDTAEVTHIDRWQYSPDCCMRVIGTDFSGEAAVPDRAAVSGGIAAQ